MTTATKPKKKDEKIKIRKFDEIVHKTWPKAKEEMEKGIKEAKKIIVQGEKHLGKLTDKSLKRLRIVVLNHRKEKRYHKLGKLAASLPRTELVTHNDITAQLNEIKKIDEEISGIKKQSTSK